MDDKMFLPLFDLTLFSPEEGWDKDETFAIRSHPTLMPYKVWEWRC